MTLIRYHLFMNILSKETDYAVQALIYIHKRAGEVVSVPDIEKDLRLPRSFLRKILQVLSKNYILQSIKGNKGGFKLVKKTQDMKLTDIMKIFQGDFTINECIIKNKICGNRKTCKIRKKLNLVEKNLFEELKKITILSLMNDE